MHLWDTRLRLQMFPPLKDSPMKTPLSIALCVVACLVACDSGSSTTSPTSNPAKTLPGVSTLQVGTETFRPFMGGYRDLKYPILRGAEKDSIDQSSLSFVVLSSAGSTGLSGGLLISDMDLGSFSLDTSYFTYRKPRMAQLSFHRHRPGIDSCYFSAMSGSVEITSLRDTMMSTGPGYLVSGTISAKMGLPWAARFPSCSDPLDAAIEFSSILLKRYN